MAQMSSNVMELFQQYSQMMLLQSFAAAGKSPNGFNPSMFGTPPPPIPASPFNNAAQDSETQFSPEQLIETLSALANISNILSATSTLKNEVSPSTSSSYPSTSSTPMASTPRREYKISVNRESAKPLQDWMNKNIRNPYPTSSEVKQLSQETGFSHKQIRNWFTNSRRRYEQKSLNSPLPWTKKDAPKIALAHQKVYEFPSITSSPQLLKAEIFEGSPLKFPKTEIIEDGEIPKTEMLEDGEIQKSQMIEDEEIQKPELSEDGEIVEKEDEALKLVPACFL